MNWLEHYCQFRWLSRARLRVHFTLDSLSTLSFCLPVSFMLTGCPPARMGCRGNAPAMTRKLRNLTYG